MPVWLTPTVLRYVGAAVGALLVVLSIYAKGHHDGYINEHVKFEAYKTTQERLTREKEEEHQAATDQIRKDKDAKISSINSQLADAISQLRNRPTRTAQSAGNGQGGTGAGLYAEDSEFLVREAARADKLRTALEACYLQYDAVAK